MAKYSLEFKLKVVNEYINGLGGTTYLSDKYNIPAHSVIQDWIDQFKQDGIEGLKREISKTKYFGEFKLHVLEYRQINRLTFKETAYHFGIRNYSNIANWQRIYNEEGFAGLNRTIGRAKDMTKENEIKKLKKQK
ncbi:MAG: transposase [Erysipelotrichaceae bacterium]|nr:transposase [Erysipelotrichaceae bacterium]